MLSKILVSILLSGLIFGSVALDVSAQTLSPNAVKMKAKAQERARSQSRAKVKLNSGTTYVGIVSDAGDTSFAITDKDGSKHTVQYSEVRSIGGLGWGAGAKLGLGIAIGAGAVLAVLAAIVASDN